LNCFLGSNHRNRSSCVKRLSRLPGAVFAENHPVYRHDVGERCPSGRWRA
jgi:hypothetical protein